MMTFGRLLKARVAVGANRFWAAILVACAIVASASVAQAAAVCPEDQKLTEPRELKKIKGVGVDAVVLETVDLTGWRELENFRLRLRKLTIAPGGLVPTHSHEDRPSIVHVVEGEILEHNAYCAVPIVHKAGDTTAEAGPGHTHWWENTSDKPVVIFSTDVIAF